MNLYRTLHKLYLFQLYINTWKKKPSIESHAVMQHTVRTFLTLHNCCQFRQYENAGYGLWTDVLIHLKRLLVRSPRVAIERKNIYYIEATLDWENRDHKISGPIFDKLNLKCLKRLCLILLFWKTFKILLIANLHWHVPCACRSAIWTI